MGVFACDAISDGSIVKTWNKYFPQLSVKTNWVGGNGWGQLHDISALQVKHESNMGNSGDLHIDVIIDSDVESMFITYSGPPYIRFHLSMLPGCCAYCVSHSTLIGYHHVGMGYGKKLQAVKKEIAKLLGFTAMICTVTSDNFAEIHILETHGWVKTNTIKNKRTGHVVFTYQYILDQQAEEMI